MLARPADFQLELVSFGLLGHARPDANVPHIVSDDRTAPAPPLLGPLLVGRSLEFECP
jgi:hypothetical protein